MSDGFFNLAAPSALGWLWLLPALAVLFAFDLRRRQRVLRLFVERSLLDDVCPRRSIRRPIVRFALLLGGLAALVVALARPRWDPRELELEQQGQNLLFCLDVSNSMRARDAQPSRLEAAKAAIRELVSVLPAGHQVGLLAYAGTAEVKCPLTPNYTHLLSALDRVHYNDVDVGGSNLGDAIEKATREVFGLTADPSALRDEAGKPAVGQTVLKGQAAPEEKSANVLIILTDGESHEGYAREMAVRAHRLGLAIYIIGLGSTAGAPIPMEDGTTLKYKGQEVITRLDDASLRAIIEAIPSRSGYLAAGTASVDLVDVYRRVIAPSGGQTRRVRYTVWQEKYQLFAGLALALVVASALASEQRPLPRRTSR